jgi:hypothetical protein
MYKNDKKQTGVKITEVNGRRSCRKGVSVEVCKRQFFLPNSTITRMATQQRTIGLLGNSEGASVVSFLRNTGISRFDGDRSSVGNCTTQRIKNNRK